MIMHLEANRAIGIGYCIGTRDLIDLLGKMMLQRIWCGCGMVIGRPLKQNSSTLLNKVHNYHANKNAQGQEPP